MEEIITTGNQKKERDQEKTLYGTGGDGGGSGGGSGGGGWGWGKDVKKNMPPQF